MGRDSKDVFEEMKSVIESMFETGEKWVENDMKSAGASVRKSTMALEKLGKEFRKLSVIESKV